MSENRFKFTLRRLEKIEPGPSRTKYYDTDNSGLVLEVFPSGRKVFRTVKRNGVSGQLITATIGNFPAVTVDMAIKQHAELVSNIIKGQDPNQAKREARTKGTTFEQLWDLYEKDFAVKVKRDERRASSQIQQARIYNNHLAGFTGTNHRKLATLPLKHFSEENAGHLIERLKDEKTRPIFNKCLTLLKSMFNLAVRKRLIDKNPLANAQKFKDKERKRYLQSDEMESFFDAVAQEEQIYQDIVKMLLFTGQRKNCVLSMRWDELSHNNSVWSIPTSKMKGKEAHTLPLPPQCVEILQRRAESKHPSGFVFPAKTSASKTGHVAEKTGASSFWRRITQRAGLYSTDKDKNLTVHDLRRSLASWQINNNVDLYTVSKTLGHKSLATTQKIYAHLNTEKVRDGVVAAVSALELAAANDPIHISSNKLEDIAESLTLDEQIALLEILQTRVEKKKAHV